LSVRQSPFPWDAPRGSTVVPNSVLWWNED